MEYSFNGYLRSNGSAATRNYVGIISSVICSSVVVDKITEKIPGTIPFTHGNGCAQLGDDFDLTKDMLVGAAANPNLHSALFVGLGCETNQISGLIEDMPQTKPVKGFNIQQFSGENETIKEGVIIADKWAKEATNEIRRPLPLSSLNVGILTVDMDEESLKLTTPIVGKVVDQLVENGVKVIMGLSKTLQPAGSLLSERGSTENVKQKLNNSGKGLHYPEWKTTSTEPHSKHSFSKREHELAILESKLTGKKPIKSVLDYGEQPDEEGLHMMNTTSNLAESLSKMVSSQCGIVLIMSSRPVLTGSVAIPCMTIIPENPAETDEIIDYMVTPDCPDNQVKKIIETLIEICSGKQTGLEKLGLGEYSIPYIGTTI